jgi:FkbM family methyltransferase
MILKKLAKNILPLHFYEALKKIIGSYFYDYAVKSHSQEGEDMVLRRIFADKSDGFYIDVGAHHPKRFSNTYLFYKAGWRGINIDAMPESMKVFRRFRPNDINLEVPVSDTNETLTYYAFNEPALNGFSKELSEGRDGKDGYRIIFKQEIATKTLESILDEHMPKGKSIDFLSVDVEGFDFRVLISNNWERYRPSFVLVEILGSTMEMIMESDMARFMRSKGYMVYAKTYNTTFFKLS